MGDEREIERKGERGVSTARGRGEGKERKEKGELGCVRKGKVGGGCDQNKGLCPHFYFWENYI